MCDRTPWIPFRVSQLGTRILTGPSWRNDLSIKYLEQSEDSNRPEDNT